MAIDPATMMMLMQMVGPMIQGLSKGGMGGQDEKFGSTYDKGALSTLDQIQQFVKGQSGNMDITQNPQYQQGNEWLSGLFNDPQFFQNFEAPLQRQFQENTVPDLANRFASMGSGGSTGSTAFRNQLGREGSNLHTNIAALRGGMQQQGVNQSLASAQMPFNNLMQMIQQSLTPTRNQYQAATPGPFGDILSSFSGGASQGIGQQWGMNQAGNNGFAGQSPQTLNAQHY